MSTLRSIKYHMICLILVLAFTFLLSIEAQAELYDSWAVVENNSGIAGQIASQLSVEVTDPGNNQVLFTFRNNGPLASIIADIYFDDGTLLGIANIINPLGVNFLDPANPANLPGANNVVPKFEASGDFSADFTNGASNGIDPGESVGIVFDLKSNKSFATVINSINVGFNPDLYYDYVNENWLEDNLRIGLHVQGTGDNENFSDSFILTPIPPSVIIGMLGICVAGVKLRKYA